MKNYTVEELQAMDLEAAKTELAQRVYEACAIFERLENVGKVHGNGHHIAQDVCAHAEKLLVERWQ